MLLLTLLRFSLIAMMLFTAAATMPYAVMRIIAPPLLAADIAYAAIVAMP